MHTITLTTDYGYQDHYVAVLKAALLRACPSAQLIDVTHGVGHFNILHAEIVTRQTYGHFQAGTVHLICVHEQYAAPAQWLMLQHDGHVFVCPNHGLLPMLFPEQAKDARRLLLPDNAPATDVAYLLGKWAADGDLDAISDQDFTLQSGLKLRPVVTSDRMRGTIVHIDHYGNVLTNIKRAELEAWLGSRTFKIYLKRNEPLTDIFEHFAQAPSCDPMALWSIGGNLLVAIRNGNAHRLLNLELNDVIDIALA